MNDKYVLPGMVMGTTLLRGSCGEPWSPTSKGDRVHKEEEYDFLQIL